MNEDSKAFGERAAADDAEDHASQPVVRAFEAARHRSLIDPGGTGDIFWMGKLYDERQFDRSRDALFTLMTRCYLAGGSFGGVLDPRAPCF